MARLLLAGPGATLLAALGVTLAPLAGATADDPVACQGVERAGGLVICEIPPDATLSYERWYGLKPDGEGRVVLGFDRQDYGFQQIVYGRPMSGAVWSNFGLKPDDGDIDHLESIEEWKVRAQAWQGRRIEDDLSTNDNAPSPLRFRDGFRPPVSVAHSGADGTCDAGSVRYDISGLEFVTAPAGGRVAVARDTVVIDHGQGLFSMLSGVESDPLPALVEQGDTLGTADGRLCWRSVWRGNTLDPLLNIDFPERLTYDQYYAQWEADHAASP